MEVLELQPETSLVCGVPGAPETRLESGETSLENRLEWSKRSHDQPHTRCERAFTRLGFQHHHQHSAHFRSSDSLKPNQAGQQWRRLSEEKPLLKLLRSKSEQALAKKKVKGQQQSREQDSEGSLHEREVLVDGEQGSFCEVFG